MAITFAGFRDFMEDMDPSREKDMDSSGSAPEGNEGKEDYAAALGDEQGMPWDDIVKVFEGEPWVSSHFGLGSPEKEILYKLSPWEIVKGSLSPTGADIRMKPRRNARTYLKGNRLNKSDYVDTKRYTIGRKELLDFLTAGWTPAVQAAAGGGMQ